MHYQCQPKHAMAILLLFFGWPGVVIAQSWQADLSASSLNLAASMYATDKDGSNGGMKSDTGNQTQFTPHVSTPSGIADWAADYSLSVADGAVSSESSHAVTINGVGTDTLIVSWKVALDLNSHGVPNGDAVGAASTSFTIKAIFDLPPSSQYLLFFQEARDDYANSIHEDTVEDFVLATDQLSYTFGFPPGNAASSVTSVSTIGADADPRLQPPFYPPHNFSHGGNNGAIVNAGGNQPLMLTLTVQDEITAQLTPPGVAVDSANGLITGQFVVRMEAVPEPAVSTMVLVLMWIVAIQRRTAKRQAR